MHLWCDAGTGPHRACAAAPSLHCASAPSLRPRGWRPQRRGGCLPLRRHAPWLQGSMCTSSGTRFTFAGLLRCSCCARTWYPAVLPCNTGGECKESCRASLQCLHTMSSSGEPEQTNSSKQDLMLPILVSAGPCPQSKHDWPQCAVKPSATANPRWPAVVKFVT